MEPLSELDETTANTLVPDTRANRQVSSVKPTSWQVKAGLAGLCLIGAQAPLNVWYDVYPLFIEECPIDI